MKKNINNSNAFTLIEVLASIVLVSIILTLVSTYFVNSYQQSNQLSKNFNSIQICQSLLDVYKKKEFSELNTNVNKTLPIDVAGLKKELQLEDTDIPYSAEIKIKKHTELSERMLVITVTVFEKDGKNKTSLEGYVRK